MHGPHDGRYAPSPTGTLHVGNLRTALAAWLVARCGGGRFLLRIDDLDPDRSRRDHEAGQLRDLRAIGIDWDGEPVRQTDRLDRYERALEQLAASDLTYPCFCTRAEVRAAASAPHGPLPEGTYPGTCARIAPRDAARRVEHGEAHCVRVRAGGARVSYEDGALGHIEGVVDDFVVRRRDGVPAYNLATSVDEHELGIGEVVRGADLAETTPRHIWLMRTLGLVPVPTFTHVPLVLGADGARLAKRHGAVTLADLAAVGTEAPHVVALLGRSLGMDVAAGVPTTAADLLATFEPARMPTRPWVLEPGAWAADGSR